MTTVWTDQQKSLVGNNAFFLVDDVNFLLIDDAGHYLQLQQGHAPIWYDQQKS